MEDIEQIKEVMLKVEEKLKKEFYIINIKYENRPYYGFLVAIEINAHGFKFSPICNLELHYLKFKNTEDIIEFLYSTLKNAILINWTDKIMKRKD